MGKHLFHDSKLVIGTWSIAQLKTKSMELVETMIIRIIFTRY